MTRLIDADAVKAVFEEKSSEAVCGAELCKAIISRIDEAPTVDAIPIEWLKEHIVTIEQEWILEDWEREHETD